MTLDDSEARRVPARIAKALYTKDFPTPGMREAAAESKLPADGSGAAKLGSYACAAASYEVIAVEWHRAQATPTRAVSGVRKYALIGLS